MTTASKRRDCSRGNDSKRLECNSEHVTTGGYRNQHDCTGNPLMHLDSKNHMKKIEEIHKQNYKR